MRVRYSSRANREVRSIAEYYTREAGAKHAQEFLDDLEKIINRIKVWPGSFPSIGSNVRRAGLNKYPFIVLYEVEPDESARILAVRHHKQNPDLGLVN